MRRKLKNNEIIIKFPNENYPILLRLIESRDYQFRKDKVIGDTVFFWFGDTYSSVSLDDWSKIKEWVRNNKIDDILE